MVKLAKSAEVIGNVTCARIVMEDGAHFNGRIDMQSGESLKNETAPHPIDKAKQSLPQSSAEAAG